MEQRLSKQNLDRYQEQRRRQLTKCRELLENYESRCQVVTPQQLGRVQELEDQLYQLQQDNLALKRAIAHKEAALLRALEKVKQLGEQNRSLQAQNQDLKHASILLKKANTLLQKTGGRT